MIVFSIADSGRRTNPGVSYWKASSSSTRWPQGRNQDGTRVSTRNGSDTEKGNGGPVVDAAGVRDGTLGQGLGRRPISAGRLQFPAPENDFYWVWS
jgi:hypothetical protein